MDCSPPGSSIHGIFQARVLEWVAISFSRWVIFLTLGSKPSLPHCRWILYQLNHKGTSPWNSPGQNTGVGSLSLPQGIFLTQGPNPGLLHCRWILYQLNHKGTSPWNSPGQNIGVGSLSCLQGIFPTQGSNPSLPHYRQILYQLSHQGSPWAAKWLSNSGSKGSIHAHPGQN